jgi:hypothetical protein
VQGNELPWGRATPGLYLGNKVLGQAAQNVVYAWLFIAAGTSSTAAVGLSSVFVALLLPAIIAGPYAGAIVDRIGPGRGYVLGSALRLGTLVAAFTLDRDGSWAWAAAFGYALGSQFVSSADFALVRVFRPRRSGGMHSGSVALQYVGQGAGMLVVAPVLYRWGGTPALLAGGTAAIAIHASVALALASRLRRSVRQPHAGDGFGFRPAVRFLLGDERATTAVAALAAKSLISRAIFVALPLYLEHDMGLGRRAIVFVVAPGVAGVLVGLAYCARGLTVESARRALVLSMVAMAVAVFALAALDFGVTAAAQYSRVPPVAHLEASLNTTFAVALPLAFLLGIALTVSLVAARVVLTEVAPAGQQARVFAIQETLTEGLLVLPLLLVGVGVQFAGARIALGSVGGLTVIVLCLSQLPLLARAAGYRRSRIADGLPVSG